MGGPAEVVHLNGVLFLVSNLPGLRAFPAWHLGKRVLGLLARSVEFGVLRRSHIGMNVNNWGERHLGFCLVALTRGTVGFIEVLVLAVARSIAAPAAVSTASEAAKAAAAAGDAAAAASDYACYNG